MGYVGVGVGVGVMMALGAVMQAVQFMMVDVMVLLRYCKRVQI